MDDLKEASGDGLRHYWMTSITVDGIVGHNTRDYGYQFYTMKHDISPWSPQEDEDGYVDDSNNEVDWHSPYIPLPLSFGDINEKCWLEDGDVSAEPEVDEDSL